MAARDLQKSVLVGLERHWEQVPGPLMQGFEVLVLVVIANSGGVGKVDAGGLRERSGRSLDSSAQRQVVPSEQKPQGSGSAVAAMMDEVEAELVRTGGRRVENCAVKSISKLGSGFDSRWRLFSESDWGECGRLNVGESGSATTPSILNASSMHSHLVSTLHLPQPTSLSSVAVISSGILEVGSAMYLLCIGRLGGNATASIPFVIPFLSVSISISALCRNCLSFP